MFRYVVRNGFITVLSSLLLLLLLFCELHTYTHGKNRPQQSTNPFPENGDINFFFLLLSSLPCVIDGRIRLKYIPENMVQKKVGSDHNTCRANERVMGKGAVTNRFYLKIKRTKNVPTKKNIQNTNVL